MASFDHPLSCSPAAWPVRILLAVLLLLLPMRSVGASGSPGATGQPIRIGAIFAESGLAAPHNRPMLAMTELAVSEVNARGGVLGRPLQLVVVDNLSTPIGSAQAAHRLVDEEVTAVIGAHWSSHSLVIAPILEEAGIPMISPGSTNPEVTKGREYVFRISFVDSFQGIAMAKFAREHLKAKTAVVITNIDEEYSTVLGRFFSQAFEKQGGKILEENSYRGSATDFSANLEGVLRHRPDVVYLPGYTRDSGLCIRQAARMGVSAVFLGGDAWDEITRFTGPAINGSYQSTPWHPDVPFGASRQMKEMVFRATGRLIDNYSSPLAYDAVLLLAEAIGRAGTIDRKAIRDALASTVDFPGATGTINFDRHGDPYQKGVIIIQYRNELPLYTETILP